MLEAVNRMVGGWCPGRVCLLTASLARLSLVAVLVAGLVLPSLPAAPVVADIEKPVPSSGNALFGSDVVADALHDMEIPFIALTPGASFRGFHDSLVNHLGNRAPQMLLCLHEEHAVAVAHGWAKVTNKPIAAAVFESALRPEVRRISKSGMRSYPASSGICS